ncbi:hypothetical protein DPMN_050869 [Dreissena polymorpha]|uniref:Uncharacterized protein n=1 Tax=Dreissena polymorpha TaxID=45954 RepID=A0A9D4CGX4_DREPO|nr:hypothetical protein DPMN_050869 [Dreissena polymorpha]
MNIYLKKNSHYLESQSQMLQKKTKTKRASLNIIILYVNTNYLPSICKAFPLLGGPVPGVRLKVLIRRGVHQALDVCLLVLRLRVLHREAFLVNVVAQLGRDAQADVLDLREWRVHTALRQVVICHQASTCLERTRK